MSLIRRKTTLDSETGSGITVDRVALSDAQISPDGFVHVDAYIGRSGIFDYLASEIKPQWPECSAIQSLPDDAIIKAYRPPEEVSDVATLDSFAYMPVTNDHPHGMLTPDNVGGYIVGTTKASASMDGDKMKTSIVLYRRDAIQDYRQGKVELSIGAYNDFVWGSGITTDGKPYDMKICKIRGNHVALVDRGRAGRGVRIIDTAENLKRRKMKITINGVTMDVDDSVGQLLDQERTAHKAEVDRLNGEIIGLKSKVLTDEAFKEAVEAELKKRESDKEIAAMRQTCKDAGIDVDQLSDDTVRGIVIGRESSKTTHDEVGFSGGQGTDAPGSKPVDIAAYQTAMYGR